MKVYDHTELPRIWKGLWMFPAGAVRRQGEGKRRARDQRHLWLAAESALLAIGRLERALDHSPVEAAWQLRSELEAASSLLAIDGVMVDRDRLYALMAGLAIRRLRDYGAEAQALRLLGSLRHLAREASLAGEEASNQAVEPAGPWDQAVKTALARMAEARGSEGELLIALRTARGAIVDGIPASAAVAALPLHLARKGLTRRYLPALLFKPASVIASSEGRWLVGSLERIARGAEKGERTLDRLTHTWRDWHHRLGPRRSTSSLPRLVDAMLAWPIVTPVQASRTAGISIRGAAKLIAELAAFGIVVPATRRKSWRTYVAADLAGAASLSLEASDIPRPPKDKAASHPSDSEASGHDATARSAPLPRTAVFAERAPELLPTLARTATSGSAENIRSDEGAGPEASNRIDLSQVFAELELVTKRARAAIEATTPTTVNQDQVTADSTAAADPKIEPRLRARIR